LSQIEEVLICRRCRNAITGQAYIAKSALLAWESPRDNWVCNRCDILNEREIKLGCEHRPLTREG
jgi:hypothetical protein